EVEYKVLFRRLAQVVQESRALTCAQSAPQVFETIPQLTVEAAERLEDLDAGLQPRAVNVFEFFDRIWLHASEVNTAPVSHCKGRTAARQQGPLRAETWRRSLTGRRSWKRS